MNTRKQRILFAFFLLLFSSLLAMLNAQSVIHKRSGGTDSYYYSNDLQRALDESNEGDTLTLPAHEYIGDFQVTNPVTVIGVGYNLEATASTGPTAIIGDLNVLTGSVQLIGLRTQRLIVQGASNVIIHRCSVEIELLLSSASSDIWISECFLSNPSSSNNNSLLNVSFAQNVRVHNSLLELIVDASSGLELYNNIIFDGMAGIENADIRCNVINAGFDISGNNLMEEGNQFTKNTILDPTCDAACLTVDLGPGNTASDNTFLDPITVYGFALTDYPLENQAYQIIDTSPAFNQCDNDEPVGIYGGPQPFKPLGIPHTPRIVSHSIIVDPDDDEITIEVEVEAQGN